MRSELSEQLEFAFVCPYIEPQYYREGAEDLIRRLVPADLLEARGLHLAASRARFADMLPLVSWSELNKAPCALSVLLLCKFQQNACHFFYDMISRWLIPNRRVNVELFFASDVRLPHLSEEVLSVAEVVIHLTSAQDVEEVRRNLYSIETEIRLGVVSHYHARRILEFKGLSRDGKTAMIQEKIGSLIQSHSKDFDQGIFSQMQKFLVTSAEEFKKARDYHHISRLISNIYSVKKLLCQNLEVASQKRHVILKFLKTSLVQPRQEERAVLGILVGLNFLKEHEVFEADHLMGAIQRCLPYARKVEGSDFTDPSQEDSLQSLYLEIEKDQGEDFHLEEIHTLRTRLVEEIKNHIEQLTHPIFMPRNEEEVLKNIRELSGQLRLVHDLPQVIVSFDEQRVDQLCFTVILVKIREKEAPSMARRFQQKTVGLSFEVERVREVGTLRKKYLKEALVLRTRIASRGFIRSDHTVDLYQARACILKELIRVVGEVRDYHGGMIDTQNEALEAFKRHLGGVGKRNALLVEKFFYALKPMERRSVIAPEALKKLFLLLLQGMKPRFFQKKKQADVLWKKEADQLAVLFCQNPLKNRQWLESIEPLGMSLHQKVSFCLERPEGCFEGHLYFCKDQKEQERLLSFL